MNKIIFLLVCISILFGATHYENNYTRENCIVIQAENGKATIEDKVGFTWNCQDKTLKVGDIVDLKMHTNYTISNLNDDTIKKIMLKNTK